MSIPKLITPKYKLKLPSTGQTITYRPMLVKEEKILHMGIEAQDSASMIESLMTVLNNCIETEGLDLNNLPAFDIEYVMITLRSRSIGEVITPQRACEKCDAHIPIECDIDDIKVETPEGHNNKIQLTDDIGVIMRYPSISDMDVAEDTSDEVSVGIGLAVKCIDQIYTKDSVYKASESSKEEIEEFVNSLTSSQFQEVVKFFSTMPYLKLDIEAKCLKCGHKNDVRVRGLENFFG